ncbi:MAG: hypothetical protein LCH77_09250 [Actinobacteria bacterium]|nr:hypothetical protein [Actinomycetota bacterium]
MSSCAACSDGDKLSAMRVAQVCAGSVVADGDSLAVVDWVDELEPVAPVEAVVDLEVLAPPVDVHDAKKVAPQAIARTARDRWLMRSPR